MSRRQKTAIDTFKVEQIKRRRDHTSCALRAALKRYVIVEAEAIVDYWLATGTVEIDRSGDLSAALCAIRSALAAYVTYGRDPGEYIARHHERSSDAAPLDARGLRIGLYLSTVADDIRARIAGDVKRPVPMPPPSEKTDQEAA